MVTIYTYKIPKQMTSAEISFLNTFCTPKELEKPPLFPETKHLTSVFGKAITKSLISDKTGIPADKIQIEKNANGKPFIKDFPHIHFNVSHSEDTVAVAFCDEEIGIDIEKIKTANLKIAKRFFSKDEEEYILNHTNKNTAFFEIWTAKEAYFKRSGEGIGTDFFKTSVKNTKLSQKITTFERDGFMVSVCCDKKDDIILKPFEFLNVDKPKSL